MYFKFINLVYVKYVGTECQIARKFGDVASFFQYQSNFYFSFV